MKFIYRFKKKINSSIRSDPFSGYPNVVADKPNLGPEGPLTKIFSNIPTILFGIYERCFLRD